VGLVLVLVRRAFEPHACLVRVTGSAVATS
jgi:hypothetical protein